MHQKQAYDLLDKIAALREIEHAKEATHRRLQKAKSEYGLAHVAYGAINIPTRREIPLVAVTYSERWQEHYLKNGYVSVDPVVRAGLASVTPVDWALIGRSDPRVRKFFGEAKEFDIGANGLSVPVRGRHGEFALFSATTSMNKTQWDKEKRYLSKNLMMVAYCFHDLTLKAEGVFRDEGLPELSTREKDCLCWRGCGKSDSDIAQILSISERAVKIHLSHAQRKLGAMNTTHAVARALSFGLIAIP